MSGVAPPLRLLTCDWCIDGVTTDSSEPEPVHDLCGTCGGVGYYVCCDTCDSMAEDCECGAADNYTEPDWICDTHGIVGCDRVRVVDEGEAFQHECGAPAHLHEHDGTLTHAPTTGER